MRISDWSSDVCSSDLAQLERGQSLVGDHGDPVGHVRIVAAGVFSATGGPRRPARSCAHVRTRALRPPPGGGDRRGRRRQIGRASCRERSVRVDLGGRRNLKKKTQKKKEKYIKH